MNDSEKKTRKSEDSDHLTRRKFIKGAAVAGATAAAGLTGCAAPGGRSRPRAGMVMPRKDKLRLAYIGTGGRGGAHLEGTKELDIVCPCYCDVDSNRWAKASELHPKAARYQDYREMFDKEHKNFDAVMIGIPDHHHYPATMMAMQLGKHVYTEKPLTHTPWEARQLTLAAEKYKVVTQMGNQGHANEGNRKVYEWVRSGAIGDVLETHTWTDRPVWLTQGIDRPDRTDPVPSNLNWDVWLGPAPQRPYVGGSEADPRGPYHWFNWRGWWDFGAGALGDMACHTMDCIFLALDPGYPSSIEPLASSPVVPDNAAPTRKETFPLASVVKWEYPKKGRRRAFTAYWYDGHLRPAVPEVLAYGRRLPSTGSLFVGTKAMILVAGDYGERPRIIPDTKRKEIGDPPKMLDRSPGHFEEWIAACKGEQPMDFARSNFAYAGPFTESILLGNIALRIGQRLEWDGEKMEFTNMPEANQFVSKEYREGWKMAPV